METLALDRLTRLAQSMPVEPAKLRMERCDGPRGEVFLAFGEGPAGTIHGCWGYFGMCQAIDFEPDSTAVGVRQVLFDKALEAVEQHIEIGAVSHG